MAPRDSLKLTLIALALLSLALPLAYADALRVDAGGPGRYVYRQGFYLDAQGTSWVPFTFPQATIPGTDWILENASLTLQGVPSQGYVIVYSCRRYPDRDGLVCGPRNATQSSGERRWTVQEYNLTSPGAPTCALTAGQLCASSPPANSVQGVGTCGQGSCYACAANATLQNGQCVPNQAPPTCTSSGGFCAASPPSSSQPLTATCASGLCYTCLPGFTPQDGQCVPQGNQCDQCQTVGAKECSAAVGGYPPGTGDRVRECKLVGGCKVWEVTSVCESGWCQNAACAPAPGGSNADTSASVCASTADATVRDAGHYGTGPGGDHGIAFLSSWTGDSTGTAACCGNQQGEYYLWRRVDGAVASDRVACCNAESDCITESGQCATHLAPMPGSTTEYCFYNSAYVCASHNVCAARQIGESPYDCYALASGSATTYRWGRKDGSDGVRPAEACGDGRDNDCNGLVDCADAACAGNAACSGPQQNLKVKRVSVKSTGNGNALSVELCKDLATPIAIAPLTLRVESQKTHTLSTLVTDNIPLCSSAEGWNYWIPNDLVFTSTAPGPRTVSVTATFSGQNSDPADDSLSGVTITLP